MKQKILHTISIVLSLMVVVSSVSFTVDSHYCGEELVDVALFTELEVCGDEMDHEESQGEPEEKEGCCGGNENKHCKDVKTEIEGNPVEFFSLKKMELQKVFFAVTFIATYQNTLFDSKKEILVFQDISPPIFQKDRVVLFENFRI